MVDGDELEEIEFRFADAALKRGYSPLDLQTIIENDPFIREWPEASKAVPGAIVYLAHGWTSAGEHVEILFATPDYGGGYFVFHAMPSDNRRPMR